MRESPQTMRKVAEILREEMSRWIAGDHDLQSVLQYPKLQHLSSPCPRLITLGRVSPRISTHSFLLPRPLVHFWKGVPPYGGSHYLRHGISISISCGNSFRNSPGPQCSFALRYNERRHPHNFKPYDLIRSSWFDHSSLLIEILSTRSCDAITSVTDATNFTIHAKRFFNFFPNFSAITRDLEISKS